MSPTADFVNAAPPKKRFDFERTKRSWPELSPATPTDETRVGATVLLARCRVGENERRRRALVVRINWTRGPRSQTDPDRIGHEPRTVPGPERRDPEVDYEALVVRRNAPRWLAKLDEFGYLETRPDGTMAVNWAPA